MNKSETETLQELVDLYATNIKDLLARLDGTKLLKTYLSPEGPYASTSFDLLEPNPIDRFVAEDFLAVGFLDTPIKAASFRQIALAESELNGLLADVGSTVPLWELTDPVYDAATALWQRLLKVDGVGPTRASKLMSRKRPRLIPILDGRVQDFYGGRTEQMFWRPLAATLKDEHLRGQLVELQTSCAQASNLSELRVLDILIWMGERNPPGSVSASDD
jgi:hypothetical protein